MKARPIWKWSLCGGRYSAWKILKYVFWSPATHLSSVRDCFWQRFHAAGCSFCESSDCHQPSADHDRHEFTDAPHFTLTETFTGWRCNNHLEKWWSSSMGFGWHPIYELWNIKAMFETTNQIIIVLHPIYIQFNWPIFISIYSFHSPINILWMEENLHQLIDGLSHYL